MPIEEAMMFTPQILVNGQPSSKAEAIYINTRTKWLRFFKLVDLFGHCEQIIGYTDDISMWDQPPPQGQDFTWIQPVPIQYEQELKETDSIPRKIEWLTVNFGDQNITLNPERFIHAMNPKLYDEDKIGESVLMPIVNMLQVQIHSDWSIGQALWRRAGGLLGIFGPRRNMEQEEIDAALQSVNNHNSKTVVYVPFGWNIKEILRTSGNIAIARTYAVILEQIAAGCGIPLSVLTGQKAGGLNAGTEDQETYYRFVASKQNNTIIPVLKKYFRLCQKAGKIEDGAIEIIYPPLEASSVLDKEKELTEIGALRLIQKRMEEAEHSDEIIPTDQLVKMLTKSKR
jgi:hypothetical protein